MRPNALLYRPGFTSEAAAGSCDCERLRFTGETDVPLDRRGFGEGVACEREVEARGLAVAAVVPVLLAGEYKKLRSLFILSAHGGASSSEMCSE